MFWKRTTVVLAFLGFTILAYSVWGQSLVAGATLPSVAGVAYAPSNYQSLFGLPSGGVLTWETPLLIVNGQPVHLIQPLIISGRTIMLSKDDLANLFSLAIPSQPDQGVLTIQNESLPPVPGQPSAKVNLMKMSIGNKAASFNGLPLTLPAVPSEFNGTIYLPFRAVVQAFGSRVSWDGARRVIWVTTPEYFALINKGGLFSQIHYLKGNVEDLALERAVSHQRISLLEEGLRSLNTSTTSVARHFAVALQERNGAMALACMSQRLQDQVYYSYQSDNWVLGTSSPWVYRHQILSEKPLNPLTTQVTVRMFTRDSVPADDSYYDLVLTIQKNPADNLYAVAAYWTEGQINPALGSIGAALSKTVGTQVYLPSYLPDPSYLLGKQGYVGVDYSSTTTGYSLTFTTQSQPYPPNSKQMSPMDMANNMGSIFANKSANVPVALPFATQLEKEAVKTEEIKVDGFVTAQHYLGKGYPEVIGSDLIAWSHDGWTYLASGTSGGKDQADSTQGLADQMAAAVPQSGPLLPGATGMVEAAAIGNQPLTIVTWTYGDGVTYTVSWQTDDPAQAVYIARSLVYVPKPAHP